MKFIQSFKGLKLDYLKLVIFEVLFYLSLAGLAYLAILSVVYAIASLNDIMPILGNLESMILNPAEGSLGELKSVLNAFYWLFAKLIIIVILYIILAITASSFLRGFILTKLLKVKYDKKFIIRFIKLKLIWVSGWVVLYVLLSLIFKISAAVFAIPIMFLLYLYFTILLHLSYRKGKIKDIIKETFRRSLKSIIPALNSFWVFILIIVLVFFIGKIHYMALPAFIILFLLYEMWVKYYFYISQNRI